MKTLKFKTNIKCGGCVAKVKPQLDAERDIKKWEVNLESPDRILSIEACELSPDEVIDAVKKAGFQAESID